MKHFGDITKLNGTELPIVDIITGGSPCQDLSVAGKRAGLAGERSGLFMDQIRIIKEMRDEDKRRRCGITGADEYIRPRYMVWENVAGAFSSNKGEDFRAVLEETARVVQSDAVIPRLETGKDGKQKWSKSGAIMGDGWSIAWRVHDAQFWGVPQRRKRIALVADFGGTTAPEILFERKGLSGDIAQSGKEGERVAEDTERCAGEAGGIYDVRISSDGTKNWRAHCYETERCRALDTGGEDPNSNHGGIAVVAFEPGAMSRVGGHAYEDVAGTVRANAGDNQQAVVYGIGSYDSNAMKSDNPKSGIYQADTSRTLDLNGGNPGCNQGGMAVVHCVDQGGGKSQCGVSEDVSPTLATTHGGEPVICIEGNGQRESHKGDGYKESDTMYTLNTVEQHAVCIENHPADSRVKIREDGIVQTLSSRMETGGGNVPMVMESQTFSDVASTRSAADGTKDVHSQMMKNPEENFVLEPVAMASKQISQNIGENIGMTLCGNDYKEPQCVAYGLDRENIGAVDCRNGIENENVNGILQAKEQGQNLNSNNVVRINSVVRRLTPLEAERLQGFPTMRKVRFTEMTKDEYIAWNINEGHIVVDTEYGKVFATRGQGGIKLDEPKELMGSVVNGYRVVSIRNGNTKMQCRVHRIVWIAEHGVIPDGYVIDHINNDKQDNRLCNLQLLTPKENSTKARADGLYKIHGEAGQSKITDEVHDFIQYVYGNTDLSIRQLSEIFGISKSRVHQIIHDEAWTDIGEWYDSKGKKHKDADSPRYKALGNSIALPFWQYLAEKMVKYIDHPTMASLFDGIGGFPLVYSRCGCKPVWASEIEEFPIAVSKKHFPDNEYTVAISYLESRGL